MKESSVLFMLSLIVIFLFAIWTILKYIQVHKRNNTLSEFLKRNKGIIAMLALLILTVFYLLNLLVTMLLGAN